MKALLSLLFLLVICGTSIAQSKENYRSRNYKLNRNYNKKINAKKHRVATYKSKKVDTQSSKLKKNHQTVFGHDPEKLVVNNSKPAIQTENSRASKKEKTTFRSSNKKNGKRLINYFTMMLAFSLLLVAQ